MLTNMPAGGRDEARSSSELDNIYMPFNGATPQIVSSCSATAGFPETRRRLFFD